MSLALHCLGVTAYLACIGVHTVRKVKKKKKKMLQTGWRQREVCKMFGREGRDYVYMLQFQNSSA